MPTVAVFTGLLLLGAGIGGFAAAGFEAKALTALIPAVFGLLIGFCGMLAYRERLRKHALHIASALGLIGFLLPAGRLAMVMSKDSFAWNLGSVMLLVATLICLTFFLLCLQSFIKSRRGRAI
jgi:4-amino-4-deoxy-L-arabinose transferase-like glycosyltransferase